MPASGTPNIPAVIAAAATTLPNVFGCGCMMTGVGCVITSPSIVWLAMSSLLACVSSHPHSCFRTLWFSASMFFSVSRLWC